MGIKLQGGDNSTNLANINSLNQLAVTMPQALAGFSAGFVQASTEVDAGDVMGTRSVVPLECSDDFRTRVGLDQSVFNATFEGANIQSTHWNSLTTTTTTTQANGFVSLNTGAIASTIASGAAAYLRSWRLFPTFGTYPIYLDMWIREGGWNAVNAISEWGFLYLTAQATQQPLDGIYFRRLSGGQLKGVVTVGITSLIGIDRYEIDLDTSRVPPRDGGNHPYDPAEVNHYLISYHNDTVRFWINDVLVGEIYCPAELAQMTGSSSLPVGFRMVNVAQASEARRLDVGYVNVGLGDQNVNKPWSHAQTGMGGGAYQLQIGNTVGPTVTRAAAGQGHPASGTARAANSWLAAAGPVLNNLGGLWTSPAISTLTSDADYPVFAFQNPTGQVIGGTVVPGKTLYITGVRIGESFASVAAATNPIFLSYIVMVEGSGSLTNTSDAATTVSPKSIVIGGQGFTAGDTGGTMKEGFDMTFHSPLVVPQGRYVHLVVRPFGTVTGNTLVVRGSVSFNGYFE